MRLDVFTCVKRLIHICVISHIYTSQFKHVNASCRTYKSVIVTNMNMCDMTHSYVWHDSSIRVTWCIHVCKLNHVYVWYDSFICVTWLIYMCDMTHLYVWLDSCISSALVNKLCTCKAGVDRYTHTGMITNIICDMTHPHGDMTHHVCDMTHSHVWHNTLTMNLCDMTAKPVSMRFAMICVRTHRYHCESLFAKEALLQKRTIIFKEPTKCNSLARIVCACEWWDTPNMWHIHMCPTPKP